ncbi:MAG TPA: hypothetical protein VGH98_15400 [Gemmatimonadaceae bacterium]
MRTNDRLHSAAMNASHVRTALVAIALGAVALIATSTTASAQQDNGPTDPGVRCAAKVGPGQYEFYLPGEKATDVNGNKWVCGPDGQWFRDYSSRLIDGGGTTGGTRVTAYYLVASARLSAVIR